MKTYDLILKRRSIRKFLQKKIDRKILLDCVNSARVAPSAANLQPLEYILVTKNLDEFFSCTKWGAYLNNWSIGKDERPTAYIVILSGKELHTYSKHDAGLAAENIVLTALEHSIGSCILAALDREKLARILNIPAEYSIELVIALGYAKHESFEEEFNGSVKYWIDEQGNFNVPKKNLKAILHEEKF